MSTHSIVPFIKEYYPQYYTWERYPLEKCAAFKKVSEEWGVFSNFARTPLVIEGVRFKNAEQLYQSMKFRDAEPVLAVYSAPNPKMPAKHWETTHRRNDWGRMIVDAMKFVLEQKYEQSEEFRDELMRSRGKYIVEDQTSLRNKQPNTWGARMRDGYYEGPNLMGRLLMELRDNGEMEFHLPDDALDFLQVITGRL